MKNALFTDILEGKMPTFSWDHEYWNNTPRQWLLAVGVLLAVAFALKAAQGLLVSRLVRVTQRTETKLDDAWLKVVKATAWFFYLAVGAAIGARFLDLNPPLERGLAIAFGVLLGTQCALWAQSLVAAFVEVWVDKSEASSSGTVAAAIRFISRLVIWSILLLVVMSNLGIELSTLVAGLGVGGVAAALAVQKVLGDLFAGLSMYFDRPFDIGDFIIVGDVMGNVTKIGLRTTRIDGLGGEKVVYPNGELATRFIRNYQRMRERRVVFEFGIEYGLPARKVQQARDVVEEIIEAMSGVRFDRAHFKGYGAYSLDFEVVYYVLSRDYNEYMDRQHEINMAIYERFEAQQISFAFPTRTMFIRKWPELSQGARPTERSAKDAQPSPDSASGNSTAERH